MSNTMRQQLDQIHPRMLRARGEPDPQQSGEEFKRQIGRAVESALDRAGMTKQEAAFRMGYTDSGVIGRWASGVETPQFGRLWTLGERFRTELLLALAAIAGEHIQIETVVRVQRQA